MAARDPGEVHIRDYLNVLWNRFSLIVVTALVVFAVVALPVLRQAPRYRSTAWLLNKPPSGADPFSLGGQGYLFYTLQDFQTQVHLMTSEEVALAVIDEVTGPETGVQGANLCHELGWQAGTPVDRAALAATLRSRLSVSAVPDTRIVKVDLVGYTPALVQALLEVYCDVYLRVAGENERYRYDQALAQLRRGIPELEANLRRAVDRRNERYRNSAYTSHALEFEVASLEAVREEWSSVQREVRDLESNLEGTFAVLNRLPVVVTAPRVQKGLLALTQAQGAESAALRQREQAFQEARRLYATVRVIGVPSLEAVAEEAEGTLEEFLRSGDRAILEAWIATQTRLDASALALLAREPTGDLAMETIPAHTYERLAAQSPLAADPAVQAAFTAWSDSGFDLSRLQASEVQRRRQMREASAAELRRAVQAALRALIRRAQEARLAAAEMDPQAAAEAASAARRACWQAVLDVLRDQVPALGHDTEWGEVLSLPELRSDPRTQKLQEDLSAVRLELAAGLAQAGDPPSSSEAYRRVAQPLEARIQAMEEQITRQVLFFVSTQLSQSEALSRRSSELARLYTTQTERVNQTELLRQDLSVLQFEVETLEHLLKSAKEHAQKIQFESQFSVSGIRRTGGPTLPGAPFEPDRKRAILLGLMVGLFAGVGLAFALEFLDDTLKTPADIDRYVSAPILGAIPVMAGMRVDRRDLIAHRDPKASVAEAFRSLRTSLIFSSTENPLHTFVVTSVGPREGKTTISLNLAITMAQAGSRVLVVDGDLRRPRIHKAVGARENLGLTNVLAGGARLEDLVRPIGEENLLVLTSGPIPPNPSELIGSPRMHDFVAEAQRQFDYVVFDAPPIVAVTDAVVLGGLVDGLLLVISSAKTSRKLAARACEQLNHVGVPITGVVLNNVKATHGYYYYSGYYRYYGEDGRRA